MTTIKEQFLAVTKRLYPSGRAFRIPIGKDIEKILNAASEMESEVWSEAISVLDEILADNDNFTEEDATTWERRLALRSSSTTSLEDRKAAIRRKFSAPGGIPARSHYLFLERALQLANFDLFVHENTDLEDVTDQPFFSFSLSMGPSVPAGPTTSSGTTSGTDTQIKLGQFNLGQKNLGGSNQEIQIVANFIDEDRDLQHVVGSDFRQTFFVGGETPGSAGEVSVTRREELRQLVLQLKPLQTLGFLLVNYVPAFIWENDVQNEQSTEDWPNQDTNGGVINCVVVDETTMYVFYSTGDNTGAWLIYDIETDPFRPALVSVFTPATTTTDLTGARIEGNLMYVTNGSGGNNIQVYDITNPRTPVLLDALSFGNFAIRAAFHLYTQGPNTYFYLCTTGVRTTIINVTDPANISGINPSGAGTGDFAFEAVGGSGQYLYEGIFNNDSIEVFDLEPDAEDPVLITTISGLTTNNVPTKNFIVDDARNTMYAVLEVNDADDTAVLVFDISDASNPTLTQRLTAPNAIDNGSFRFQTIFRSNFLGVMTSGSGLYVWDIRDLTKANERLTIYPDVGSVGNADNIAFHPTEPYAYIPLGESSGRNFVTIEHNIIFE